MKVAAIGVLALVLAHTSAAQSIIYRCVGEGGGLVYSDRPCSGDAERHEIDDSRVTVYVAPSALQSASHAAPAEASRSKPSRSKPSRSKTGRGTSSPEEQRQIKCAKLDQSLRDVRTKMRTGYGVKEGERLKERQRQLAGQRRMQKCG